MLSNLSWPPFVNYLKKDEVNKYMCTECKNLMINPVQADDCGFKFCFECLFKM